MVVNIVNKKQAIITTMTARFQFLEAFSAAVLRYQLTIIQNCVRFSYCIDCATFTAEKMVPAEDG